MFKSSGRVLVFIVLSMFMGTCFVNVAKADVLKSSHYQFEETNLGNGGLGPASSASYQSALSLGDPVVGNSSSNNYQFHAGSQTTGAPTLELAINTANTNFGVFNPNGPATATAQFSVVDYTSYGYMIQMVGNPPSFSGHQIAAMTKPGTSSPGTEQFGINLVKNTNFCGTGCDVGANPDYGQFGAKTAGPVVNPPNANYGTAGTFEYNSGDTIAESPKSSGSITYTITFMVNVSSRTIAGPYTSAQQIICTGTY